GRRGALQRSGRPRLRLSRRRPAAETLDLTGCVVVSCRVPALMIPATSPHPRGRGSGSTGGDCIAGPDAREPASPTEIRLSGRPPEEQPGARLCHRGGQGPTRLTPAAGLGSTRSGLRSAERRSWDGRPLRLAFETADADPRR